MAFAMTSASQRIIDQITVITINDNPFSDTIIPPGINQSKHPIVRVGVPSSSEEFRTFLLAWERWRAARIDPRVLKTRVDFHLDRMYDALIRLNMPLPRAKTTNADAAPPQENGAEPQTRNLAASSAPSLPCSETAKTRRMSKSCADACAIDLTPKPLATSSG